MLCSFRQEIVSPETQKYIINYSQSILLKLIHIYYINYSVYMYMYTNRLIIVYY